ncbi:hypothetical protein D3C78_1351760 [compost metagenome]
MADAHLVAEFALALARLPDTFLGAVQLPAAIGLEVAVVALVAQIESQAAHQIGLLQGQADFGLVALGQEAHLIVQVDFLRRPERCTQAQQEGGGQQFETGGHCAGSMRE